MKNTNDLPTAWPSWSRSGMYVEYCKNDVTSFLYDGHNYVSVMFRMNPVKVIYRDNKTIVFWEDKTKTIVSCGDGDQYDPYAGFCAAVVKKLYGSTSHAKKMLKKIAYEQPLAKKSQP